MGNGMLELHSFIMALIAQGIIKVDFTGQIIIRLHEGKRPKVEKKEGVLLK